MDPILSKYAEMMNDTCKNKNKNKDNWKQTHFTIKHLTSTNFPYYCIYKEFSDYGEIYDLKLCENCENNYKNLEELLKNSSLLCLLNQQQKDIDKIKLDIDDIYDKLLDMPNI